VQKTEKRSKFNFEELKAGAMSESADVRKKIFQEYFDRFEELPSYLFDNSETIDDRLLRTIQDFKNDPETTQRLHKAIDMLMQRLPHTAL